MSTYSGDDLILYQEDLDKYCPGVDHPVILGDTFMAVIQFITNLDLGTLLQFGLHMTASKLCLSR